MGQYEGDENDAGRRPFSLLLHISVVMQPRSGAHTTEPQRALHPNQVIWRDAERVVLAVTTLAPQEVTSC